MANIFGRLKGKLQELLGKNPEEVEAIRIEAIRERKRAEDQQMALAKLTTEARAQGAAAARLKNERELNRQRQRLEALARQERIAKERADAARRQEQAAEKALVRLEQTKSLTRRMLLLGRAEADEELFRRTFGYDKPKGIQEDYENVKTGEGGLPDMEMFLRGYPYQAFASSNVLQLVYDPTQPDLYAEFIGGRWYKYKGVSKSKASEFYQAASKGVAVWEWLRRQGWPFDKGVSPPSYLPIDSSSAAAFAGG